MKSVSLSLMCGLHEAFCHVSLHPFDGKDFLGNFRFTITQSCLFKTALGFKLEGFVFLFLKVEYSASQICIFVT